MSWTRTGIVAAVAVASFMALPIARAMAEGTEPVSEAETDGEEAKAVDCKCEEPRLVNPSGPFGSLRFGTGIWRSAMEVGLQVGWEHRRLMAGVSIEFNPFTDFGQPAIVPGGLGFGAFFGGRVRLNAKASLRFEVIAGGSVLLFDAYGYDRGTLGLWLGMRLMGLDIVMGDHLEISIDLVDVSLPAYSIGTIPFIYQQWRWSIALRVR